MISEVDSLTGFERSLIYQSSDKRKIIDTHLELAIDLVVKDLYLEKVAKNEKLFIDHSLSDKNRIRVGPIGAFEVETMAMWLNEQISEYVFQGTMGKSFPRDDVAVLKSLVGEMIGGFKANHLVVSFEKKTDFDWQPYAGVTAYLGESSESLWQSTLEKKSSLSTFWALNHSWQLPGDDIFKFSENQILEMSRLWKRKTEVLDSMGISMSDIGWQSMAFLALGMEEAVLSGFYDDDVSWVLYDTSRRIQESLARHFGAQEVIKESDLRPSEEVMESVLAYHYGGEDLGGYAGKIIVGKANLASYSFASKKFLKRKNIFTNLNIKS